VLLERRGYRVIRFANEHVYENVQGVLEEILRVLSDRGG
jgi:very-short-patch-repair endonuclease